MVVVIDNWFRWRKWLLLQWLLSLCILDYFDWSIDENNVLEGGRDAWSTSHYSINLRVVLEVVRKVFLLRFVACATPPRSVNDFFISFLERLYFYSTLGYSVMIAASAQLFNELGIDVYIPKAALSCFWMFSWLQISRSSLVSASLHLRPFSAIFSRTFGRLTTRLHNLTAESRYSPPSN